LYFDARFGFSGFVFQNWPPFFYFSHLSHCSKIIGFIGEYIVFLYADIYSFRNMNLGGERDNMALDFRPAGGGPPTCPALTSNLPSFDPQPAQVEPYPCLGQGFVWLYARVRPLFIYCRKMYG